MSIYAMSDIHGMYGPFIRRIKQLDNLRSVKAGKDKLILLGDYIDVGNNSFKVLQTIYELQMDVGAENMIVLMGNHDKWFLDFLSGKNDFWIKDPTCASILEAFLSESEYRKLNGLIRKMDAGKLRAKEISEYTRGCLMEHHKDLLEWFKKLPLYYTTDTQIFVHAGVDEEAEDLWEVGTPKEMFLEKFPPSTGSFYKTIIAGHVSTTRLTGDRNNHDIYYDGESHFFIDGIDSYHTSVFDDDRYIPLLVYSEERRLGRYYSLQENGTKVLINQG